MSTRIIGSPLGHRISAQQDNSRLATIGRAVSFISFSFLVCATLVASYPIEGSVLALCAGGIAFALYEEWQGRRVTREAARLFKANASQVDYSAWWENVRRCAAERGYGTLFCGGDVYANALHEMFRGYYARKLSPDEAFRAWRGEVGSRKGTR